MDVLDLIACLEILLEAGVLSREEFNQKVDGIIGRPDRLAPTASAWIGAIQEPNRRGERRPVEGVGREFDDEPPSGGAGAVEVQPGLDGAIPPDLGVARGSSPAPSDEEAPSSWESPSLGLMRLIPAGTFRMGSPPSEEGRYDDEGEHEVTLSRPYLLMESAVTQEQWVAVMGSNPSHFITCGGRCPVENVSWEDVQRFIEAVNHRDGQRYRLPTEAEWEYAARGGESFRFSGSDAVDAVAWHAHNAEGSTHPVGTKQRNGYGLFDMSGNVWEWVSCWYGDYPRHPVVDPAGPDSGPCRVIRGGSWLFEPRDVRVAYRDRRRSDYRHIFLGFRLMRELC